MHFHGCSRTLDPAVNDLHDGCSCKAHANDWSIMSFFVFSVLLPQAITNSTDTK